MIVNEIYLWGAALIGVLVVVAAGYIRSDGGTDGCRGCSRVAGL